MTDYQAILIISAFVALLALGAWVIGPDDRHADARRRNRHGDRW
jgi:hypothetical protein